MRYGTLLLGGAAAFAALTVARPAGAQERPMYELPPIAVSVLQMELHQRAIALYESPDRWKEAGDLHKQAAKSLPANDAGQFFGFRQAALLYFYAGENGAARRSMEKAARVAAATGDLLTAAHTFVDAAFIAVAEGYRGKKRAFVREARRLADSSLLTADEREGVLVRIDGAPAGPASALAAFERRFGGVSTLATLAR